MKKLFTVIAVLFICINANISAQSWRTLTSHTEIIGVWEGTFTMNVPRIPEQMIPKSSIEITMILNCTASNYDLTAIFYLDRFLTDFINMPEISATGMTKDMIWQMFVKEMSGQFDYQFSSSDYSIRLTMSGASSELIDENSSQGKIMINAERTVMRLIFNDRLTLGLGDEGLSEITLYKK